MREFEVRRCLRCGAVMRVVEGSERSTRTKVFFTLRCPSCGHVELDWHVRDANGNRK